MGLLHPLHLQLATATTSAYAATVSVQMVGRPSAPATFCLVTLPGALGTASPATTCCPATVNPSHSTGRLSMAMKAKTPTSTFHLRLSTSSGSPRTSVSRIRRVLCTASLLPRSSVELGRGYDHITQC